MLPTMLLRSRTNAAVSCGAARGILQQPYIRHVWTNIHAYDYTVHRQRCCVSSRHNHTTPHRCTTPPPLTPPPQQTSNHRRRIDDNADLKAKNRRSAQYGIAAVIFFIGMGYASVPLYRAFCRVTGFGGTTQEATQADYEKSRLTPGTRDITVSFQADTGARLHWDFYPTQSQITVRVGEPALAFFTAKNKMNVAITGVATYNVLPMRAGLYFAKVQCFCFDEQRLRPNEEVDMPVFFYIDPSIEQDKRMADVNEIVLSYTFWPMEIEDEAEQEQMNEALARSMELREAEIEAKDRRDAANEQLQTVKAT